MIKFIVLFLTSLLALTFLNGCFAQSRVQITSKANYYIVKMNISDGDYYQAGVDYGKALKETVPNFPKYLDTYVWLMSYLTAYHDFSNSNTAAAATTLQSRAQALVHNMPEDYQKEIQGLASVFANDTLANEKMHIPFIDKLMIANADYDVYSPGADCSMFSAFGNQTAGGKTIIGRAYDFDDYDALVHMHAIFIVKNPNGSITYSIGFLPILGVLTGFNSNNLYLAFLEADTPQDFDNKTTLSVTQGDHELHMAMRYILDHYSTEQQAVDYFNNIKFPRGMLMTIGTPERTVVLEKQIDGSQGVRTQDSTLAESEWPHPDMIAAVNTFLLPGSPSMLESTTFPLSNPHRWQELNDFAKAHVGTPITVKDIETMMGTHTEPMKKNMADVYNAFDLQTVVTELGDLTVHVFFAPTEGYWHGVLPDQQTYEDIDLQQYNSFS